MTCHSSPGKPKSRHTTYVLCCNREAYWSKYIWGSSWCICWTCTRFREILQNDRCDIWSLHWQVHKKYYSQNPIYESLKIWRKIVDDRTVPLPQNWNEFPAVPSKKQELALLLSKELIAQAPGDKIIVVHGVGISHKWRYPVCGAH